MVLFFNDRFVASRFGVFFCKRGTCKESARKKMHRFQRMNGLGNRFTIFDGRVKTIELNELKVQKLCKEDMPTSCDQFSQTRLFHDVFYLVLKT